MSFNVKWIDEAARFYASRPEPESDRPTLADRLGKAEEKYRQKCAKLTQLEHDYEILRDKYTKLEQDNKAAHERLICTQKRLASLDLMGHDLEKIRREIGTKEFKRILDGDK